MHYVGRWDVVFYGLAAVTTVCGILFVCEPNTLNHISTLLTVMFNVTFLGNFMLWRSTTSSVYQPRREIIFENQNCQVFGSWKEKFATNTMESDNHEHSGDRTAHFWSKFVELNLFVPLMMRILSSNHRHFLTGSFMHWISVFQSTWMMCYTFQLRKTLSILLYHGWQIFLYQFLPASWAIGCTRNVKWD